MARNRTPAHILQIRGAYKKNPQRQRQDEPIAAAFKKTAPTWLSAEQKKIWREILRAVAPGVLQSSDRLAVEQLTVLVSEWRRNPGEFQTSRHALMLSCFSRLGMTPADRGRVVVPRAKPNKFAKFDR